MIANGLARRPAYLLLFGLGVIGGSVAMAVGVMGDGYFQTFSIGSLFMFMLVSAMAVVKVEEAIQAGVSTIIHDTEAKQQFMDGPNAVRMSGTWTLTWRWSTREGAMAPDDSDVIALAASSSIVFGTSYDDEHGRTYWMIGRIDDEGDMPALFWGANGTGPVGCAFLTRQSVSLFIGSWKGINKNGIAAYCDVIMERKG